MADEPGNRGSPDPQPIDVVPTIIELLDADVDWDFDGRTLVRIDTNH